MNKKNVEMCKYSHLYRSMNTCMINQAKTNIERLPVVNGNVYYVGHHLWDLYIRINARISMREN